LIRTDPTETVKLCDDKRDLRREIRIWEGLIPYNTFEENLRANRQRTIESNVKSREVSTTACSIIFD